MLGLAAFRSLRTAGVAPRSTDVARAPRCRRDRTHRCFSARATRSAITSRSAPAPTGPAATLSSSAPNSLTELGEQGIEALVGVTAITTTASAPSISAPQTDAGGREIGTSRSGPGCVRHGPPVRPCCRFALKMNPALTSSCGVIMTALARPRVSWNTRSGRDRADEVADVVAARIGYEVLRLRRRNRLRGAPGQRNGGQDAQRDSACILRQAIRSVHRGSIRDT